MPEFRGPESPGITPSVQHVVATTGTGDCCCVDGDLCPCDWISECLFFDLGPPPDCYEGLMEQGWLNAWGSKVLCSGFKLPNTCDNCCRWGSFGAQNPWCLSCTNWVLELGVKCPCDPDSDIVWVLGLQYACGCYPCADYNDCMTGFPSTACIEDPPGTFTMRPECFPGVRYTCAIEDFDCHGGGVFELDTECTYYWLGDEPFNCSHPATVTVTYGACPGWTYANGQTGIGDLFCDCCCVDENGLPIINTSSTCNCLGANP